MLHLRLAALAVLIAAFAVGMAVLLIIFKVQSTHLELRHGRFDMVAREVDRLVESSLSLGVPFDELPRLQAALDRQNSFDRDILSIDVVKLDGTIRYSSDTARVNQRVPDAWRGKWAQIAAPKSEKSTSDAHAWRLVDITSKVLDDAVAGTALVNAFGEREGYVAVRYTLESTVRAQHQVRDAMLPYALKAFAAAAGLIYALLLLFVWLFERNIKRAANAFAETESRESSVGTHHVPKGWTPFIEPCQQKFTAAMQALHQWQANLSNASDAAPAEPSTAAVTNAPKATGTPSSPARVFIMAGLASIVLVIACAIAALGAAARTHAESALAYETMRKAETVARSLAASFERAAELKIPLEQLPGIAARFEEARRAHAELSRISLTVAGEPRFIARTPGGEALVESVVESAPVTSASGTSELLEVAIDPRFIARTLRELWLDFVVIMVVAAFVTLELIYFFGGPMIVLPLRTLTTSLLRLGSGALAGPIPARFGGALSSLAQTARTKQDAVLSGYRVAHRQLRERLRAHREHRQQLRQQAQPDASLTLEVANSGERLRAAVHSLRALRREFGLRLWPQKHFVGDPSNTLGAMRAPFFLLLLAEDLSRSFLPVFAGTMQLGGLPLSREWVVGLPIVLFMLIVALSQPVLGGWCDRVGRRRAFLLAAATGVVAHLLSSQATTLLGLLAWRGAAGMAWAVAFVAAQGIVLDNTDKTTRAKGLASFVTVIMVSMVCGPSIGGLLADGIGHRATFMIAAACCLLAFAIGWRDLPRTSGVASIASSAATKAASFPLQALRNPSFLGLLLLAAAPAKLILVAYCFYLIPLYLNANGSSSAMAGRVIMIYSVLMVLLVPVAATQLERLRSKYGSVAQRWFVCAGLLLSSLAGFAIALPHDLWGAVLLVTLLGVAQALSISPQAAMVPELGREAIARYGESAVYGCYRLVERIGNAMGPIVAAALLHFGGYRQTFIALAVLVLVCAVLFAWRYILPVSRSETAEVRA